MKYGIGQPVRRKEDARLLTGRGRFGDDLRLEGQVYAHVVYADHAHADIVSIDTSAAGAAPGVIAVLTGADAEADGLGGVQPRFMPQDFGWGSGYRTTRPILAARRVRHAGERVAAVVAETAEQAQSAAELIKIAYSDLPAISSIDAAIAPNAPLVHDDSNGNSVWTFSQGDAAAVERAIQAAPYRVKVAVRHPRVAPMPMEPRTAIGVYDTSDGRYTLYSGTQAPHILRFELASWVFKVPETQFRVVSSDVGGAFGLKTTLFAEDAIVLWAARRVGRPVKWTGTRSENLLADDQGRGSQGECEMGLDGDGRILAFRSRMHHDVGAYIAGSGTMPMVHTAKLLTTVYRIPQASSQSTLVFTNAPATTPYRGAGRPEAVFAIEKALDRAARDLGIDRVEIRRINLLRPNELPFKTISGFIYDSGEFQTVLDSCARAADWSGFAERRATSAANGLRRGIGISYYTHDTGNQNERMEIRFDPSGGVTVLGGTANTGMGHETVYAQMTADWLGVPIDSMRVLHGDTDAVSFGRGSYASRSMTVAGSALRIAADRIIEKAKVFAGRLLETDAKDIVFDAGKLKVVGTDKTIDIRDVAKASFKPGMPIDGGVGLEAIGTFAVTQSSFPNGCHICEVEVDPDTGEIRLDRYTIVDDFGRVINPLLATGQILGGVAQGYGAVMKEEMTYASGTGQLNSGSLMDYAMPRAHDFPAIAAAFHEVPCKTNPAGVKGAGEGGTVGSEAAIYSAVVDALGDAAPDLQIPLTAEKVWRAAQGLPARSTAAMPAPVSNVASTASSRLSADAPQAGIAPAAAPAAATTERVAGGLFYNGPIMAAGLLLLASIAVNIANIVARYVFGRALFWADEAMVFLVIWSVCLAGIGVAWKQAHLNMDLLIEALPRAAKSAAYAIVTLTTCALFGSMAWIAATVTMKFFETGQRSVALGLPMSVPHLALLVGFAFSAIAVLARVLIDRRFVPEKTIEDRLKSAI